MAVFAPCAVSVAEDLAAAAPWLAWRPLYLVMAEALLPLAIFASGMPIGLSGLFWCLGRRDSFVKAQNQTVFAVLVSRL
jgi:hypothetical protein